MEFWTLDTETRGLFGKIFRWRAYYGDGVVNGLVGGFSGDDAVTWLMKVPEDQHIYIHNLEFDLSKLLAHGLKLDLDNSRIINRQFVIAKILDGPTLHCSWFILRSSLESLSKSFDLGDSGKKDLTEALVGYRDGKGRSYETVNKKGEVIGDKEKFFKHISAQDPMLNEYLDYDVISLHEILSQLVELSGLEDKFAKIMTTPQLAMSIFKQRFHDDYQDLTSNISTDEQVSFFRHAYIGARTEVFRSELSGAKQPGGYHYDVNSLYPYVMQKYEYPYGKFRDETGDGAEILWKMVLKRPNRYKAAIIYATVKAPKKEKYPVLPVKAQGKLLFCVGEITGYWVLPELLYALERGAKVLKIHRITVWKNTRAYFKEFIDEFYQMKRESSGGKKQFAKDIMNNFYGKMGMQTVRENFLPDTPSNRAKMIEEAGIYSYEVFNAGSFIQGWNEIARFTVPYVQPQIAAYVTAYARLELIMSLHREVEQGNKVYYCDTDSLVLENSMDAQWIDDGDIGKWKEENQLERGIFLQPKLYAEKSSLIGKNDTIKGKGIPRSVLESMDFSFYETALEKIKHGDDTIKIYSGHLRRRKIISGWKQGLSLDEPVIEDKAVDFGRRQKRMMDWSANDSKPWDFSVFADEAIEKLKKEEEKNEKKTHREIWNMEHPGVKSLWSAVLKTYGGVKKSSEYPNIPRWMIRKNGTGLDEMAGKYGGLRDYGFYFETSDDLYEALKVWYMHTDAL